MSFEYFVCVIVVCVHNLRILTNLVGMPARMDRRYDRLECKYAQFHHCVQTTMSIRPFWMIVFSESARKRLK